MDDAQLKYYNTTMLYSIRSNRKTKRGEDRGFQPASAPSGSEMDFTAKFAAPALAGLPKYAQLREMLAAAINSGDWKPGDKMPTEAQLARSTPYSLGTVQKALRALVDDGLVTRTQGSGTFVNEPRQSIDAPLHL